MKKITFLFLLIVVFNFISCGTAKDSLFAPIPQKIKSISIENWTAGRRESGSGTAFVIELEKPLKKNIHLEKIYFRNLETEIVQVNETKFRANFHYNALFQKYQTSAIANKDFHLKENEAVIEYQKNNQKFWHKCTQIKEIVPKEFP